jgi:hypothetical protein
MAEKKIIDLGVKMAYKKSFLDKTKIDEYLIGGAMVIILAILPFTEKIVGTVIGFGKDMIEKIIPPKA